MLAAAIGLIAVVGAPGGPSPAAQQLDKLGKEAYRKERYADAVAAFEGAYLEQPLPKYLYNLGKCHEKLGDLARASHFFERYLDEAPEAEDRDKVQAVAKMLRIRLAKTHTRLIVRSEPTGALVKARADGGGADDGGEGTTPFSEWLPFGDYVVTVSAEGRPAARRRVVLRPGAARTLMVDLDADGPDAREAEADGDPVEPPAESRIEESEDQGGNGWWWYAAAGTLVAGGLALAALAEAEESDRDELIDRSREEEVRWSAVRDKDDKAQRNALGAWVLLGAGGVAAVTGFVW